MTSHKRHLVSKWFSKIMAAILLAVTCGSLPFENSGWSAQAQTATATLSGTVTDPNNAVVPGAHVTAGGRETLTNSQGAFLLRKLPFGRLEVNAQLFTGRKSSTVVVEMGADPLMRTGVNLAVRE